ncbi:EAL domain-containing protein [Deinococcus sp. KSM4-11]|uniref:putative bifunctional diguanylate cyclase/phosphodiesterase n=1 Tax=Deinococcus sp. KSM4-11 TaxID=2568654 RepID=UPI0010A3ADE9|nr:EAL domain-containing protein [Deinococcus sp. KSM4-11]THF87016.1 EAL domain-containing protein [Deinococcus sp. KSM4-11]
MTPAFPAAAATLTSMGVVLLAALVLGVPAFDRIAQRGRGRRQALAAGTILAGGVWGVQMALLSRRGVNLPGIHLALSGLAAVALCCGLFLWYRHYAANRPALTSTGMLIAVVLSLAAGVAQVPGVSVTWAAVAALLAASVVGWSASWLAGRASRARPWPPARPLALIAMGNGLLIGGVQHTMLRFLPDSAAAPLAPLSPIGLATAAIILVVVAAALYSDVQLRRSHTLDRLAQERTADLARERDLHVALLESLNDQVIVCDADGQLVGHNDGATRLHGRTPLATLAPDWAREYGLYTPDFARHLDLLDVPLYRALSGEAVRDAVIGVETGGVRRVMTCNANPIRDAQGQRIGAVVAMNDVTEREQARAELRRTAARHAEIINTLDEGLLLLDLNGAILTVNARTLDLLHWTGPPPGSLDELTGTVSSRSAQGFALGVRAESFMQIMQGATTVTETITEITRRDSSVVWLRSRAQGLFQDGQLTGILYVLADVTDRQELREELHRLSRFEALTNLPNRLHFQHLAAHSPATPERTVVTAQCVNITELRRLGRAQLADALAVRFSRELMAAYPDALQFGQLDEQTFVALLPHGSDELPGRLLHPVGVLGEEVFPKVKAGARAWPDDTPVETVLQEAETALQAAQEGKLAPYEVTYLIEQRRTLRTEARLRHALKYLPFTVQYQPIVNLNTGGIVKAEALVRWIDEELGVVPPDQFIPIAERLGQVHRITDFVIEAALVEARRASGLLGRPVRIAVNLSPTELNAPDFMDRVYTLLSVHPDAPELLAFEVTEGAVLKNLTAAVATLTTLRQLGFGLALDDFGTGYSALGMLQHLPIHHLKLDRTFVWGIEGSDRQQILTHSVVELARRLNIDVVAEGIETSMHDLMLREMHCAFGQGYLYSRPTAQPDWQALDGHIGRLGSVGLAG